MPENAKKHVQVDYVPSLAEIPEVLRARTAEEAFQRKANMPGDKLDIENRIALEGDALSIGVRSLGQPSFYTCPECHGSMVAIREGSIKRFRCRTGPRVTRRTPSWRRPCRASRTACGARWLHWKNARCCCRSSSSQQKSLTPDWQPDTQPRPGGCAGWGAACESSPPIPRLLQHSPKSAAQPERDRSPSPVIQPG